jgi:hypothetical protein
MREAATVRKLLSDTAFERLVYDFYRNGEAFDLVHGFMGRALNPYMNDIADAVITELGGLKWLQTFDPQGFIDMHVASFIKEFLEVYVIRHIGSSFGQINSLFTEPEPVDAVLTRLDEWEEKRPDKIARNESTRGNNAMFSSICFYFGFRVRWVLQGDANCPWCKALAGKTIGKYEEFLKPGDSVTDKDGQKLKSFHKVTHPPAHRGCDCTLSI